MKRTLWMGFFAVACVGMMGQARGETLKTCSGETAKKCAFEQASAKELDGAIVPNFFLEGNAIPTQKRNAAMLKCRCGKRLVFALLDTSGYSADVQQKYHGMALIEHKAKLGEAALEVGAYGFGLDKPAAPSEQPARVVFYDIAGQKVGEASAPYDAKLAQPTPLQVVTAKDQPARLYLGRYFLEIR
jgi:hypothetical protein